MQTTCNLIPNKLLEIYIFKILLEEFNDHKDNLLSVLLF